MQGDNQVEYIISMLIKELSHVYNMLIFPIKFIEHVVNYHTIQTSMLLFMQRKC